MKCESHNNISQAPIVTEVKSTLESFRESYDYRMWKNFLEEKKKVIE